MRRALADMQEHASNDTAAKTWSETANAMREAIRPPYEHIYGMKPVNDRYNASVGTLMGMGMLATLVTIEIDTER